MPVRQSDAQPVVGPMGHCTKCGHVCESRVEARRLRNLLESVIADVSAPTGRLRLAQHPESEALYRTVKEARKALGTWPEAECSCAMTESSARRCAVHGEDAPES